MARLYSEKLEDFTSEARKKYEILIKKTIGMDRQLSHTLESQVSKNEQNCFMLHMNAKTP